MKVNRRELNRSALGALAIAAAGSFARNALAQTPASATSPVPARDFLGEARASHVADAAAIAKVEIPQSVEPAFEFRP